MHFFNDFEFQCLHKRGPQVPCPRMTAVGVISVHIKRMIEHRVG